MEIIRRAADVKCSGNLQLSVQIIDGLLGSPLTRTAVKSLFGVADLEHDEDFASLIEVCRAGSVNVGSTADPTRFSPLSGFGRRGIGTLRLAAPVGTRSAPPWTESSSRARTRRL